MTDQVELKLKLILESIASLKGQANALVSFCTAVAQTLPKDPKTMSCFSMYCEKFRPDESKDAVAAGAFDAYAQMFLLALKAPADPLPPTIPSPSPPT